MMNELDQEMERQVKAAVWQQAVGIPMDEPLTVLAATLIDSMAAPGRSSEDKLALLATTYVAALKMIVEAVPQGAREP